ncbi:MAG: hypothetical protein RIF46_14875, partial [Cyclobacteriaceae bacterium]
EWLLSRTSFDIVGVEKNIPLVDQTEQFNKIVKANSEIVELITGKYGTTTFKKLDHGFELGGYENNSKTGSLTISTFESIMFNEDTGGLILDDCWETSGSFVKFYDKDLNLLSITEPFTNGYRDLLSGFGGSKTAVYVTSSADKSKSKLLVFDEKTLTIQSRVINNQDQYTPTEIIISPNSVSLSMMSIMGGTPKMLIYNHSLELVKEFDPGHGFRVLSTEGNSRMIYGNSKLQFYDELSMNKKFEIDLNTIEGFQKLKEWKKIKDKVYIVYTDDDGTFRSFTVSQDRKISKPTRLEISQGRISLMILDNHPVLINNGRKLNLSEQ